MKGVWYSNKCNTVDIGQKVFGLNFHFQEIENISSYCTLHCPVHIEENFACAVKCMDPIELSPESEM